MCIQQPVRHAGFVPNANLSIQIHGLKSLYHKYQSILLIDLLNFNRQSQYQQNQDIVCVHMLQIIICLNTFVKGIGEICQTNAIFHKKLHIKTDEDKGKVKIINCGNTSKSKI